jgi:hypothetical protein
MHKNATKCNETLSKWFKNKHGASKIIDTFETYHLVRMQFLGETGDSIENRILKNQEANKRVEQNG